MKLLDLKELIKKSMLEVSPNSGAMTPEEEKIVADYEEEEANKYALDNERPMEEAASKAAAILNRPSNRMTFEQMGMIMMLADELGGEENAKADEFLSGTPSKMEADRYIQELIAKIDEDDVLAEAERIVAAWAEKQTIKEEMIGGYVDVMGPDFENGVNLLGKAWNTWKAGELTEPEMIDQARQDIITLIQNKLV